MHHFRFSTGLRIAGAFAIVLLILASMTAVSVWRQQGAETAMNSLVYDTLAKERLLAERLSLARLNGLRAISIAHSDSLEVADYFQAELNLGDKLLAASEARLDAMPSRADDIALWRDIALRKAAYLAVRQEVFKFKDMGRTQDVATLAATTLDTSFKAYLGAIDSALQRQSLQARELALASAAQFQQSRVLLIGLGLAALALAGLLSWLLTRSIVGPLKLAVAQAAQVADGDLRASSAPARKDEIGDLLQAQNEMAATLSSTVRHVHEGALAIERMSQEIAAGNLDLSHRTERQASALVETAASMDALTGAVQRNGGNARKAEQLASSATQVAGEGSRVVADVIATMAHIDSFGKKIVDITSVIDGIAFQTNILALNAAVEAARAGEHGRGFAVVASEVRNLSQRSATAARDINKLVLASAAEIGKGSTLAQASGATMDAILHRVRELKQIIDAISAAGAEQEGSIAHVNGAVIEMENVTQQNAALVEQAAAASASMRERAQALARQVEFFRVGEAAPALVPALPVRAGAAKTHPSGTYFQGDLLIQ